MNNLINNKKLLVADYCRHEDNCQWYLDNIPFFECPDKTIQEIYYYRWFLYKSHIIKTGGNKFAITEFSAPVSHSGTNGTISCAAGHHIYEGRWLKNSVYINDYEKFWISNDNAGEARLYSFWLADACFNHYMISGDIQHLSLMFDGIVDNYRQWEKSNYDECRGLFWQIPDRDGMEYALIALSYGNGHGGEGFRLTLNSYMYGDAAAICKAAKLLGRKSEYHEFKVKAEKLKKNIQDRLWNRKREFFVDRRKDNYFFVNGIELSGYIPWYFNMPDIAFAKAWKFITDGNYFNGKYGLRTLEKNHEDYLVEHSGKGNCMWNGFTWPYATSQALTGMANLLNNHKQSIVNSNDYFNLLKKYALCQYKNGVPYTAECFEPDAGYWYTDRGEKSRNYNHSTYCDLIITGLVGLRPREDNILQVNPLVPGNWDYFCLENISYHGSNISIVFDKNGCKYGRDKGFSIYVNGNQRYNASLLSSVPVIKL
jgi:hypothetical protein